MPEKLLDLQTNTFRVSVCHSSENVNNYSAKLNDNILEIKVPATVNYHTSQDFLKRALPNIIEHFLKLEAERKLHTRLKELSEQCKLKYNTSKVFISRKTSAARQCKSRQLTLGAYYKTSENIKMNAFLMLMSDDCIDEVLIHELCHSVHQNHSKDFYQLLGSKYPRYKEVVSRRKEIVRLVFDYFR